LYVIDVPMPSCFLVPPGGASTDISSSRRFQQMLLLLHHSAACSMTVLQRQMSRHQPPLFHSLPPSTWRTAIAARILPGT
jgi:hypothetical protein